MQRISGLSEIEQPFAAAVCDLWGVIHDGRRLFPGAIAALRALTAAGKPVAILSNSPRPTRFSLERLQALGAGEGWYDFFVTSGDLTRSYLAKLSPAAVLYHLGHERDAVTLDGLSNPRTNLPEAADIIVCTGFSEALGGDLPAHARLLETARRTGKTLVCANPDKVVPLGSRQVYCAGAIAERFEAEGGKVVWLGKPAAIAFKACLAPIREKLGREVSPAEVLTIGDNLETDIRGAAGLGMRSVFITEGLHGHLSPRELADLTRRLGVKPDYVMPRLKA